MASRTGFVYHEKFLEHDTGPGHPERSDRLRAITNHLKEVNLWQELQHLMIDEASEDWLLQAHSLEHNKYLRQACLQGLNILDAGDTHASRESYNAALLAVGGVLAAVDAVMNNLLQNVFCAIRPPGHHAERDKVMGFCLLNNVAIAARYAQRKHCADRILILDWDVHHGNGTQQIFYDDKSVMYISTHQYPFYPGTGSRGERGIGQGEGYTLNIPMFAGSGEEEFIEAFKEEIIPSIDNYRPDMILISAGFDAHKDDPLANLNLTEESFGLFTSMITDAASKYCNGRIVSVLEGGYNLKALALSVESHIRKLIA
ncbi:MAG: histone deacetylase [Ignavibacteriales bacterium]|nr:histone deacetylase [Ignavibacteriales bacterium]